MFVWVYTGEVNARRVREKYLQSILRQDIAFFDKTGAGEVATRIQTDTRTSLTRTRIAELWFTSLLRFGPTRHFREGGPSCELLSRLRDWFRLGLHPKLAPGPRDDVGFALHRDHGDRHEQVCLQVHAVSSFLHADSWLLSYAHV